MAHKYAILKKLFQCIIDYHIINPQNNNNK
jgi:hypothetical protein